MLCLTRPIGSRVLIRGSNFSCWVTVVKVDGQRVRLGFDAERSVEILRDEIIDHRSELNETVPATDSTRS